MTQYKIITECMPCVFGQASNTPFAGRVLHVVILSCTPATATAATVPPLSGSKLYILNGNYKCDKEAGCSTDSAEGTLTTLRQVAASFDAGSSS